MFIKILLLIRSDPTALPVGGTSSIEKTSSDSECQLFMIREINGICIIALK